MKRSRIVFSFDDARSDTYKAVKIAEKYGIKTTVNVTTSYVENTINPETRPSQLPAMTVEQVIELSSNPFVELAGHSDNHVNDFDDIVCGRDKLQTMIGSSEKLGFASPSSKIDLERNPLEKFKENNFLYVRIGPKRGKLSPFYRYIRKACRILKNSFLYAMTYTETLQETISDNYLIHGVPVLHDNTTKQIIEIVQHAIKKNYDCVLIFHSILKKGEFMAQDNWSWDESKYIKLCEFIKEKIDVGIVTTAFTKELVKIDTEKE